MALSSFLGGFSGSALGRVLVEVGLDTRPLDKGLAESKAKLGTAGTGMASGFKTAMVAGAVVAGAAIVKFGATSVKAFQEMEISNLKLQNTLKNNPQLADVTAASWDKQSHSLQELTGVQDEAIRTGQALLGQFDLTGRQVQQLIPLIVDLSQKMGIDLSAAAKAVGKATAGNTGLLQRYGIMVTKSADGTVKFDNVVKALASRVGGFAASEGKTFAGQMRILSANINDVQEQFGHLIVQVAQGLLPVFKALVPVLKFAADHLGQIVEVLGLLAAYKYLPGLILGIAGSLQGLAASSAVAGAGFVGFAAAIGTMATPLFIATAAIVEFTFAAKVLQGIITGNWLQTGVVKVTGNMNALSGALKGTALGAAMLNHETQKSPQQLMDDATAAQKDQAAHDKLKASLEAEKAARDALAGGMLGLVSALRQLQTDQKTVTDLQAHGKRGTQEYKDAITAVVNDQLSFNSALSDYADNLKTGQSWNQKVKTTLELLGAQAGISKGEVDGLTNKVIDYVKNLKGVPKSVRTEFFSNADQFNAQLDALISKLHAVGSNVIASELSGSFKGKATGGPVTAGTAYIVGERGPELFISKTAGTIVPNVPAVGGLTININAPVYGVDDLERKIAAAASRRQLLRAG